VGATIHITPPHTLTRRLHSYPPSSIVCPLSRSPTSGKDGVFRRFPGAFKGNQGLTTSPSLVWSIPVSGARHYLSLATRVLVREHFFPVSCSYFNFNFHRIEFTAGLERARCCSFLRIRSTRLGLLRIFTRRVTLRAARLHPVFFGAKRGCERL
jgi:hypothetical protein